MSRAEAMLAAYLDLLLAEPTPSSVEGKRLVASPCASTADLELPRKGTPDFGPQSPPPDAPSLSAPTPVPMQVEAGLAQTAAEPPVPAPASAALAAGAESAGPVAAYRMCHVAGMAVALPESLVAAVLPLPPLQPVAGAASWVLGQGDTVLGVRTVADLASLLGRERSGHGGTLLVLGDCPWMLAVDDAGEVLSLRDADIRWRTSEQRAQGGRCWLAGMASAPACALIDRAGLRALLDEKEAMR